MSPNEGFGFEPIIFSYIDELKILFFPDQWSSAFLDYSKNEILALLFLYRNKRANMTEISDYINAPLNTTTGVISRLEKKLMVERKRDDEDRRVVNIVLTEKAEAFIDQEKKIIEYYFREVYKVLTDEEKLAAMNIFNKIISILKQGRNKEKEENQTAKKVKRIIIE
ncbi:MarR family winged helix-turn-helix transcriptional regulator [Geosporobacter ferrireducens]|uniref:MarR family transcriptional regulator n=1 Tax=Geosporobacter ferrireducens TaxID=1424294 RepID=A0A1D8GNM4_9FIRM|nr:MarR family transcriptional regulator [Geosporobacter ferrireducens]AOT72546.1 MarR family transcriptional regulator [Geosporobacter ferrireducens]MTI54939.1 MarR family transcriptional regulator [Geosporobacter ferrireducens]